MKSTIYGIAFILASLMIFHHTGKTSAKSVTPFLPDHDEISGDWDGIVEAPGTKVAFKLNFKLEGEKVTGTIESGHTGAGTISNGVWKNDKLSFTANFAKHESIDFKAELNNDKLVGEYATEGRVSKWEATKKSGNESAKSTDSASSNSISGDWVAFLTAQDTSAPVVLKFKLEDGKVSGTFASDHLGSGTIEDGTWADNKISFTIKVTQATIKVWGILKDGKLTGDFDAGQMSGKWEAKRK